MTNTHPPAQYDGWRHLYSGKVRDLYEPADGSAKHLLVVTSNRVSAYDFMLEPPIPGKGAVLTALSRWWFDTLGVEHHLASDGPAAPPEVAARSMVTHRLEMLPIECVVRGAITGSGFAEYVDTGAVCGIELPAGLEDGDLLDTPIFTPAYKAPLGDHDENISLEQAAEIVGPEMAQRLKATSLDIFTRAREIAAARGLILADTKFEFGVHPETGALVLADEVLTSDSSRFWDAEAYAKNTGSARMQSFDKQIVRDWLSSHWDRSGEPPVLPDTIVQQTQERYHELFSRLTGLEMPSEPAGPSSATDR